jgi:predicted RNase H-like HicB family nuclease
MRYAVVIEKADGNYSAYVPDLPGCVATGETLVAIEAEIREAIRFHLDGLKGGRNGDSAADQHRRIRGGLRRLHDPLPTRSASRRDRAVRLSCSATPTRVRKSSIRSSLSRVDGQR